MKKYTNKILVIAAFVGVAYLGTMGVLTVQELKNQQEYLIYRKFCRFVCWAASYGNVEVGTTSAPLTQKMTADLEGNVEINGISGKVVVEESCDVVKITTPQTSWKVNFVNFDNTSALSDMKIILEEVE
jgi:hypothetical protein